VSRRHLIEMTEGEVLDFLDSEKTVTVGTLGPRGWPHLMPLWYVVRDGRLWGWTYAKSQKAVNLERDPRATVQVEAGEVYEQLRGVVLECEVVLHRDPSVLEGLAVALVDRYSGKGPEFDPARDAFRAQVPKRVGLEFVEKRRMTWDHRKLAGVY
jgi:PPOX class probable F420-dependent enzyme